jgi:PAS domain S-box-containing protein
MQKGNNLNHPPKGCSIKVEPIRDARDIRAIQRLLAGHPRNLALFNLGIHTTLRPRELLGIRVADVQGLQSGTPGECTWAREDGAFPENLDREAEEAVRDLLADIRFREGDPPPERALFLGRRGPLSVPSLNNMVKKWCANARLPGNFGGHSLRKTFGYQQLVHQGTDIQKLLEAFRHSTPRQLFDYLCIRPEEADRFRRESGAASSLLNGRAPGPDPGVHRDEELADGKTETDLGLSREKYKIIFENANDLIVYISSEGQFIEINRKLQDIFGYRREDFIGRHYLDVGVLGPEDKERAAEGLRNTLQGRPSEILEFQVWRKDGSEAYVEVNSRVIKRNRRIQGSILIIRDITERKKAEEAQRRIHEELEQMVRERTANLEEANTALRVLLKKREEDRSEMEEKILFNVRELVLPYLEKVKNGSLDEMQRTQIGIVESNLNDILSPFLRGMSLKYKHFTPTEIQVAHLVKHGRATKEIAELLNLSTKTIEFHRDNIREKVGIKNQKVNLRTFLLSLQKYGDHTGNIPAIK